MSDQPTYHKLLERQLNKLFPERELLPEEMKTLLNTVDRTYKTFERDKQLSEHAFKISEQEYKEVLKNLKKQTDIKIESVLKLKEAILSLDPTALGPVDESQDDLIGAVGFLKNQILKAKILETELIHAKVKAEKAATVKSDFLSVMSHEIRTPLNAITGIAHMMMSNELPSEQMENMKTLNIAAENLLNLINDILDYSKMEEGKIALNEKNTDLQELMGKIRLSHRGQAEQKGNQLKFYVDNSIPTWVMADELRLGQVLNNLISNALKFTKNGLVLVELHLLNDISSAVEIMFSVTDTGIGIEKEKQEIIFQHFTQAHSEITQEFGGSGLGLGIIEHILSMMGTNIELESELGKGSRFYFKALFKNAVPNLIQASNGIQKLSSLDLKGIRILLVEDVEFNVVVAEKMLSGWNALVDIAENGMEAIAKAKSSIYELILMDLQMPVMDGYTASTKIREFNKDVPIIALTASGNLELQQRVMDAGMNALVSKPFKPLDLFQTIKNYSENYLKKLR